MTKYGLSLPLSQSRIDKQDFFGDKTGETKVNEKLPQKEERIKITEWRGGRV